VPTVFNPEDMNLSSNAESTRNTSLERLLLRLSLRFGLKRYGRIHASRCRVSTGQSNALHIVNRNPKDTVLPTGFQRFNQVDVHGLPYDALERLANVPR